MFEAEATEFPFVAAMPKREKGKLAKLWDHFNELRAIVDEKGMLIPQSMVAELLGISKQRLWVLGNEGRLEGVTVGKYRYYTEQSLIEFAKLERVAGRPVKLPENNSEMWKAALRAAKASREK